MERGERAATQKGNKQDSGYSFDAIKGDATEAAGHSSNIILQYSVYDVHTC